MFKTCLSCQKSDSGEDLHRGYHRQCSLRLFGTAKPPIVPFKSADVISEAQKMVGKMSISGVQPKLSTISDRRQGLMTVVDTGGRFILKPPTDRFEFLPENENLCMNMAAAYGIEVPPHGLLPLADDRLAYCVRRFDRMDDGSKLQQEDFQQLLQTQDKYEGCYERIANFIKAHSNVPGLDLLNLFERALLFFVLGNGDAHLKNFSLLEKEEIGYSLSPAYDIVSSRLALPQEREEMCLSLHGRRNNISKNDFLSLGEHFGLSNKQIHTAMERLRELKPAFESMIRESFLIDPLKEGFLEILSGRMNRLFG